MSRLIVIAIIALVLLCGGAFLVSSLLLRPASSTTLTLPDAPQQVLLPTPTLAPAGGQPLAPIGSDNTPAAPLPNAAAPFTGTFAGTLSGDNGSSAPATLSLVQTGNQVSGRIEAGPGLLIDGGNCGAQAVPAGAPAAAGQTDPNNPNRLQAAINFEVQGLTITLNLGAEMSPDGQTMAVQATVDLPFICGRDPVISGTFARG